jgi:hypothetical protein
MSGGGGRIRNGTQAGVVRGTLGKLKAEDNRTETYEGGNWVE